MPALRDGGSVAGTVFPGFTRGYSHWLPTGATTGLSVFDYPGFHPGLFSFAPYGSNDGAAGVRLPRVSPGAIFICSLREQRRGCRCSITPGFIWGYFRWLPTGAGRSASWSSWDPRSQMRDLGHPAPRQKDLDHPPIFVCSLREQRRGGIDSRSQKQGMRHPAMRDRAEGWKSCDPTLRKMREG